MRISDSWKYNKQALNIVKNMGVSQNVSIRVLDESTGEVIQEHSGHNTATNSLITGIGHYLVGEGVFNQGYEMLHKYVPLYMSLGTMGLLSQEEDEEGLPADLGVMPDADDVDDESNKLIENYKKYLNRYSIIISGYQYVDAYGEPLKDDDNNSQYQTDIEVTVDQLDEQGQYTYMAYVYPPNNTVAAIQQLIDSNRAKYMPKANYCVYYSKDLEDDGTSYVKWYTAKGIEGIDEAISEARQCPYCTSGTCQMGPECLECVFPGRKNLIEALQSVRAAWYNELQYVEAKLDEAYDALDGMRLNKYLDQCPGYGADGSCVPGSADNNYRKYFGLGPTFANRSEQDTTIDCELISDTFPRQQISFRQIVPEYESESKNTIDITFSALISTGALKQFRAPGKDYIFITEAGLWSDLEWNNSGENGLLAGYRIAPPNPKNWAMNADQVKESDIPEGSTAEEVALQNRKILKQNILKVGLNQVVQVIWKIQVGGVEQFEGLRDFFTVKNYRESEGLLFGHQPYRPPYPPEDDSE